VMFSSGTVTNRCRHRAALTRLVGRLVLDPGTLGSMKSGRMKGDLRWRKFTTTLCIPIAASPQSFFDAGSGHGRLAIRSASVVGAAF
jgi:hypothetical protein